MAQNISPKMAQIKELIRLKAEQLSLENEKLKFEIKRIISQREKGVKEEVLNYKEWDKKKGRH